MTTITISIVDSLNSVVSLLDDLETQPINPPSLYVDIEGVNLSRHGSISIIQLFHLPQNRVFLIDVFVLQAAAFNTSNASGTTLRSIFESSTIQKVFFDVRNDADALYAHFNIALQCVHDVQLLEVATRTRSKARVSGLGSCIKHDARLPVEALQKWKATKDKGIALFAEEKGGSYEVFNNRPMSQDIIDYCAQDVIHLPTLWELYSKKISKQWLQRVEEETRNRVLLSRTESYVPNGEHKVWSPWATAAEEGAKNDSEKPRKKKILENGTPAVRSTYQEKKPTLAEISAEKALRRKAEKQLLEKFACQSPADTTMPQGSGFSTASFVAPTSPAISKATLEFPLRYLPKKSNGVANATAVAKVDTEFTLGMPGEKWTCTTCNRQMLKSQEREHQAGKAHINRLKQLSSAGVPSKEPLQTITAGKDTPLAATTTTAGAHKAKPKPTKATQRGQTKGTGHKNKPLRVGAAVTTSSRPPYSLAYPNWGFIGFGQSGFTASYGYDEYNSEKGDNFGLCDKDCGWCGHCMDSIDI